MIGSDIKLADFGYNEKFRIANNSKKYLKGPMFCQKGPVLHLLGGRGYLKGPMLYLFAGTLDQKGAMLYLFARN